MQGKGHRSCCPARFSPYSNSSHLASPPPLLAVTAPPTSARGVPTLPALHLLPKQLENPPGEPIVKAQQNSPSESSVAREVVDADGFWRAVRLSQRYEGGEGGRWGREADARCVDRHTTTAAGGVEGRFIDAADRRVQRPCCCRAGCESLVVDHYVSG